MACILLTILIACDQNLAAENPTSGTQKAVKLTDQHPSASFPVAPETLVSRPPVLAIVITAVVNPQRTPFEIVAYLLPDKREVERQKILIGNFSLYPPDHPSTFLLSASGAFAKLGALSPPAGSGKVEIVIEMVRINKANPWTHVELTLAPPEWRQEKGN